MDTERHQAQRTVLTAVLIALVTLAVGYQLYEDMRTHTQLTALNGTLASTTNALTLLEATVTGMQHQATENNLTLADQLYKQQQRTDTIEQSLSDFTDKVGSLSGSVRTLEKLSTTDKQLLQKYSRVYFLNENYLPADLTPISEEFDYPNNKQVTVLTDMWPFLKNLLRDAKRDNTLLQVLSGYRSFAEQTTLKHSYTVRYGVGANQFSADQGYSEHQLGTAVDFTTPELGENIDAFGDTDAYQWLLEHAYRYGFILSYPEGNSYYEYEPWHWRFVGVDLATYLHRHNKNFYDLEQREIDTYLSTLFDD